MPKKSKTKKDAIMKVPKLTDVALGGAFRSDGVAYGNGMGGPDEWTELITKFEELSGYDESGGAAPDPSTGTGNATASSASPASATAKKASASTASAQNAAASSASASQVTEFPVAETYLDLLGEDSEYTPDDVNIPCDAVRTSILNATRSIAEINFRRAIRSLGMASIYGATRGTIAKYFDALTKLGRDIESGIVAGEHEFLQGKIAEAQVKANIVGGKLGPRATVIASVVSDRMRGRTANAQLSTGVSERNASLDTGISETNAKLGTGTSERNASLGTGVSETNAKLETGVSERNAQLITAVSETNAKLCTEVSIVNANNVARITVSLNNFYASIYSSEKRVLQSGLGSLLGSIANQCGEPGIAWITVT